MTVTTEDRDCGDHPRILSKRDTEAETEATSENSTWKDYQKLLIDFHSLIFRQLGILDV